MRLGAKLRIAGCAALALFVAATAAAGTGNGGAAARASDPSIALVCTVSGLPKGGRELTAEAVCSRFLLRIREALGLPAALTGLVPRGDKARWVKLEIRLLPQGRAEATLTSRLHGKATDHPLLAVQVMDKPLGLSEIDRLARLAGRTLAGG